MKTKANKKNIGYKQLSAKEREIIARLLNLGKPQKEIAITLGRSPSTISREISRNVYIIRDEYIASHAHERSILRKAETHAKERLKSQKVRVYVESKLKLGWSPEIIAGRIRRDISGVKTNHESIYQYIYNDRKDLKKYLIRSHKKRGKRRRKRGKKKDTIPERISIEERPKIINNRQRIGDWEADLIVSHKSPDALLVLRERKLHLTYIKKLKRKTALQVKAGLIDMLKDLPPNMRKSITFDNGPENALHYEVAKQLNLKTYFCNPYSSWEKGSIENTNGLIRRYFPKKTNFTLISTHQTIKVQEALNNRPRKSLRFLTPYEFLKDCA